MTAGRVVIAQLVVLLATCAAAADKADPLSPEQRSRAQAELTNRLVGCASPQECAERTLAVFLETPVGRPLWTVAREHTVADLQRVRSGLLGAFASASPPVQHEILLVFEEGWDHLLQGVDFQIAQMVKTGLLSPQRDVRIAAARLMATRPIWRIVHAAIDAAEADPQLALAALRAIEVTHDPLGARWAIEQLSSPDDALRRQALLTLRAIGAPAAERLRERLDAADPAARRVAMDAFLRLAGFDDVPRLHTWLEVHAGDDAALVQRVSAAIAELEAGRYAPSWPEAPPLNLD